MQIVPERQLTSSVNMLLFFFTNIWLDLKVKVKYAELAMNQKNTSNKRIQVYQETVNQYKFGILGYYKYK